MKKNKLDKFTIFLIIIDVVLISVVRAVFDVLSNHSFLSLIFMLICILVIGIFSFLILKEHHETKDIESRIDQKKNQEA